MCGRINLTDSPGVQSLCEQLGINLWPNAMGRRFVRATDTIPIVFEEKQNKVMSDAIWWLLLEPAQNGFKPSKYTSFNTRYDKLNTPRSAGYKAYRESRCIVVAAGFGETQGKGSNAKYTDFEAAPNEALALGGLYRNWICKHTGDMQRSCSIVTLPPHEKLMPYHTKASPLILNQHDGSMALWLDSSMQDVDLLAPMLNPSIPQDLLATEIDKPSLSNPVAESIVIKADSSVV